MLEEPFFRLLGVHQVSTPAGVWLTDPVAASLQPPLPAAAGVQGAVDAPAGTFSSPSLSLRTPAGVSTEISSTAGVYVSVPTGVHFSPAAGRCFSVDF